MASQEEQPSSKSKRLPRVAVILAAGQGTRMRSALPKVLHEVAGRPMLAWVLDAARGAGCERLLVVVGHEAERVRSRFDSPDITWVYQHEQLGTGHAVLQAAPEVTQESLILVLSGDVPLVSSTTLNTLADMASQRWGAFAVAMLEEPGGLGRVLTHPEGNFSRIVEAVDATPEELAVQRVNAGLYALPGPEIFAALSRLGTDNAQGEIYLTDAVTGAASQGSSVGFLELEDPSEAWGVNDRSQLAQVHRRLLQRSAERLMRSGVTILDPDRTVVEPSVEVGRDTVLHPGVTLLGHTVVGEGCTLHTGVHLRDSHIAGGVTIEPYSCLEQTQVADGCRVGPFARLRPGAILETGARVGNFVEIKNSRLGEGSKAGHLAYLGDAQIGERANIGAGVVTCNYDGQKKHRTEVGKDAFVGSDTMLVAPVSVGDNATTAAGSVITNDVPAGDLGVGRARQRNVSGWAQRRSRRNEGD